MGVHDWSRMPDGLYRGFNNRWIAHLVEQLNNGVLPDDYSAETEQYFGPRIADILTLGPADHRPRSDPSDGGLAVATVPPKVRRTKIIDTTTNAPSFLAVRRDRDGRLVAVIEVVSGGNKDSTERLASFVAKVREAVRAGVHVCLLDILPPTNLTPDGLHPLIEAEFGVPAEFSIDDRQPEDRPVALLAYEALLPSVTAYIEYLSFGETLPEMPLFLAPGRYVNLPLEATYAATIRGMSKVFRRMLPGEGSAG